MKKILISTLVAFIAAMTMSCTKELNKTTLPSVEKSTESPAINFIGSTTNIFNIPANSSEFDFTFSSNVPVLFATDGEYKGQCFCAIEGTIETSGTANGKIINANGGKPYDYTFDNCFALVQGTWGKIYYDFINYGAIETYANFRVRGSKGTRYVDLSLDEKGYKDYKNTDSWFILGTISAISEIKTSSKDFVTLKLFKEYFQDMGFTPQTHYSAESVDITIKNDTGEATVTVYGKTRDKEIAKLLEEISIGSTIEIPALFKDAKGLAEKNFNPVPSCSVLPMDNIVQ